ncbi:DMT family transporter [Klebsiella pneumoniae]
MKIMAALSSTLMLACVKGIDGSIPVGEVIFFRSVIALIPLLCWLKLQGGVRQGIQTHNVRGHFVRGLAGTISMYLSYLSLLYNTHDKSSAKGAAESVLHNTQPSEHEAQKSEKAESPGIIDKEFFNKIGEDFNPKKFNKKFW